MRPSPALALWALACDPAPDNTGQVSSNNPPSLASLTLSPDPARAADAIRAEAVAVDIDGHPLTLGFTWTVDGAPLAVDGDTLPPGSAVRDQVVAVEVTVSDGFSFGAPATASLTLLNTAPVMASVAIDPPAPALGEPLTCVTASADDDGDPLTRSLRWFIDDAQQVFTGEVLADDLPRNTAVRCEAMVDDGDLASEWVASPTVYIGNSPPGAPDIALDPDPPTACQGGAVVVTRAAYDPDGDALTYAYAWRDEAGSVVCEAASCGGGVFVAGAPHQVAVRASDGFLEGPEATLDFTPVGGGEVFGNGADDDCDGEVDEWIASAWQADGAWWSATQGEEAGVALAAGDLDGDGRDDLALAANAGAVHLLLAADLAGASVTWPDPAWTLDGAPTPADLATGDADGDGLDDLLIGSPGFDGQAGTDAGAALLVLGDDLASADVADLSPWRVEGGARSERLGSALALGDLDGDGYADAVVAHPEAEAPGREAGALGVFTGLRAARGVVGLADAQVVLEGGGRGGKLGSAVTVLPDLDGDGVAELAAGAPEVDDGGADAGALALWYGGALSSGYRSDADLLITGAVAGGALGREPVSAADVDGDGLPELVVGADTAGGGALTGALYLFAGVDLQGGALTTADAMTVIEADPNAALGLYGAGAALADADGDGRAELLAGAGGSGTLLLWSSAELAAGGALAPADAAIAVAAEDGADRFGRHVRPADLDGDGEAELVAAAPRSGVRAEAGGAVYAFDPPYGQAAEPWSPDCEAVDGRVYCRVPLGWAEARARCQDMGLDLARLDSGAANAAAAAAAAGRYPPATSRGRWWLGLSDQAAEGSWRWLDDADPTAYSAWASGSPSASDAADCAALNAPAEGQWRDLACETPLFFICGG